VLIKRISANLLLSTATATILTTSLFSIVLLGFLFVPPFAYALTINGTNGNDVLEGTDDVDAIYGNDGNDRIKGYKGGDSLYGGRGDDIIYGGSGDDNIYAWYGDNYVSGGDGDDNIQATGNPAAFADQNNRIFGYAGADIITVNSAGATVRGGTGNDHIELTADSGTGNGFLVYGEWGNDYIRVFDNAATVYGGDGIDHLIGLGEAIHKLNGGNQNDWIEIHTDVASVARGGAGDDLLISTFVGSLYGEDGNDILESRNELASNKMYGGPGADEFRCYGEHDVVMDFSESDGDEILGECESE
jgi:Ca2+-binding RTX toxin-like protein